VEVHLKMLNVTTSC